MISTANDRQTRVRGLLLLVLGASLAQVCHGQETADWVASLYRDHAGTRLVDLVLPGTHDSGSYAITAKSKAAPGAPKLFGRFGSVAASWGKTQDHDLERQLQGGIRYLDLRIAQSEGELVLVHGLVSCPLAGALRGVARFARAHPREVVLLDMQSMPGGKDLDLLDALLQKMLGKHLVRLGGEVHRWTLKQVWASGRGLVVLSRDRGFAKRRAAYRPRSDLDNLWANARDLQRLKSTLDRRIAGRDRRRFQVACLTFTPDGGTVAKAPLRGVFGLRAFSKPLFRLPGKWIPEWLERGWRPNVVAVDFYDRTDIVASAIAANRLLLR